MDIHDSCRRWDILVFEDSLFYPVLGLPILDFLSQVNQVPNVSLYTPHLMSGVSIFASGRGSWAAPISHVSELERVASKSLSEPEPD